MKALDDTFDNRSWWQRIKEWQWWSPVLTTLEEQRAMLLRSDKDFEHKWQLYANDRIEREREKIERLLGQLGDVDVVLQHRRSGGHDIHVTYTVDDYLLLRPLDQAAWGYIAERLGHEVSRYLSGMSFGAIAAGRERVR